MVAKNSGTPVLITLVGSTPYSYRQTLDSNLLQATSKTSFRGAESKMAQRQVIKYAVSGHNNVHHMLQSSASLTPG